MIAALHAAMVADLATVLDTEAGRHAILAAGRGEQPWLAPHPCWCTPEERATGQHRHRCPAGRPTFIKRVPWGVDGSTLNDDPTGPDEPKPGRGEG